MSHHQPHELPQRFAAYDKAYPSLSTKMAHLYATKDRPVDTTRFNDPRLLVPADVKYVQVVDSGCGGAPLPAIQPTTDAHVRFVCDKFLAPYRSEVGFLPGASHSDKEEYKQRAMQWPPQASMQPPFMFNVRTNVRSSW